MARFDLTDFEWSVISRSVAEQAARRSARRRPARSERDILAPADRRAPGRIFPSATVRTRPASTAFKPLAQGRRLGSHSQSRVKGL